jgi:hypothetical protein
MVCVRLNFWRMITLLNFRGYIVCKYDEKVVASSYGLMEKKNSREFCGLWGN